MSNIPVSNHNTSATDVRAIPDLATKCGIKSNTKGFDYFTDALAAYIASPSAPLVEIYATVAQKHGIPVKTLMLEISHALSLSNLPSKPSAHVGAHIRTE